PQTPALLRQAEKILSSFKRRVDKLRARDAEDFYEFTEPEISGIAGTYFSAVFSYHVARQLAARHPSRINIEWEGYEEKGRLVALPFDANARRVARSELARDVVA